MDPAAVVVVLAAALLAGVAAAVVAIAAAGRGRRTPAAADGEAGEQALDLRFDAVHEELRRVGSVLGDLRAERARHQGELIARLEATSRATTDLHRTAAGLREALASPKARGQWGERTADDVLRLAGFVEGVHYVRQRATASGTIPDVSFLLPGELLLHMDVKFPLANHLRALEADGQEAREAAERAFLADVRARIRELTARGYVDPATTVDFVLLFIPNESIYGFVHDRDPGLVDAALSRKVVLCSPFTLFAVLAVIRQAVDAHRLARASDDVLAELAAFGREWDRFCEHLDRVAGQLDTASRGMEGLAGLRRRQLQKRVDAARQLHGERSPGPVEAADDAPRLAAVAADAGDAGEQSRGGRDPTHP
ncbi:MAG: DNA recombination protein RmuC [Actinobacteria bacterium]|nr:DNA recombination protein RmuC [Actinomycetota bacterium]